MRGDVTRFLSGVILLAGLISASCSDVMPTEPTASAKAQPLALAAEPAQVTPEFLPTTTGCGGARPFRARFVLIFGGMGDFVLQDLQVGFNDRFGVIAVPSVISPLSAPATSFDSSGVPVRVPTSTPIPFPTTGPNSGVLESINVSERLSERLPVLLEFGCRVQPHGTIVVTAGTRDRRGRRGDHRLTIDVGD
jgi:hypothetical protein